MHKPLTEAAMGSIAVNLQLTSLPLTTCFIFLPS